MHRSLLSASVVAMAAWLVPIQPAEAARLFMRSSGDCCAPAASCGGCMEVEHCKPKRIKWKKSRNECCEMTSMCAPTCAAPMTCEAPVTCAPAPSCCAPAPTCCAPAAPSCCAPAPSCCAPAGASAHAAAAATPAAEAAPMAVPAESGVKTPPPPPAEPAN